jgi:nicotinamide mononucleotide transporter
VPASLPEWIAVALALTYVLAATRQSRWCWPAAAASAAIYLVLFARGGLPMQAALQVFYIAMAVYGWRAWGAAHGQAGELPVSTWPVRRHLLAAGAILGLAAVNGLAVGGPAATPVQYADALVAWGSVLATWLVTRKVLENWLYWIAMDLVATVLYYVQGFHATAGLFALYVVLATRGYLKWRADLAHREPVTAALDSVR